MIRCKTCSKFAVISSVKINEFQSPYIITIGSCKFCGYKDQENRVDYDDWEELGIDY